MLSHSMYVNACANFHDDNIPQPRNNNGDLISVLWYNRMTVIS